MNIIDIRNCLLTMMLTAMLVACGKDQKSPTTIDSRTSVAIERTHDPKQVALGKQTFETNCKKCHGEQAVGEKDWNKPDEQGKYSKAPPLNGTGHAWHHSRLELKFKIEHGGKPGESRMPAWKNKLSDAQINAVIVYFQSLWPDAVYGAWVDRFGSTGSQE